MEITQIHAASSYQAIQDRSVQYAIGKVDNASSITKNSSSDLPNQKPENDSIYANQKEDSVEISEEALNKNQAFKDKTNLSEEDKQTIKELKKADQEVKTHEQAHRAAGGQYVRGATNYRYERGPDGVMYAVAGEVKIDMSEVPNNPEATIQKMQIVRKAAMAPANPSPQDKKVAQQASQKEARARADMNKNDGKFENVLDKTPLNSTSNKSQLSPQSPFPISQYQAGQTQQSNDSFLELIA